MTSATPLGGIAAQLIYPLDDRPTPECHASTIVETHGGTIAAAWFGGTHESAPDVGIWFSRFVGGVWERPVEVATGEWTLGRRFPCWNPVLFQAGGGPLLLFYKVGPRPSTWWGEMMLSDDEGRTWRDQHHLPRGGIGPVKNKPIELPDGAILCPSSSEHDGWRVHFEVTRDLGHTWETIGPVAGADEFPAIQPTILLHPDGRLQALCRTNGRGVIAQTWSADSGATWSRLAATSLPNPDSGIDAVTLSDGRHLLVYNPLTEGRHKLSVAVSADGQDWREVLKLEDEAAGEFSYPAVIQAADGTIHITDTFHREAIKHVVVPPQALP